VEVGSARVRVLIGAAFGVRSPVATLGETLYLDVSAPPGAKVELGAGATERAVYSVTQRLVIDEVGVAAGDLAVLAPGIGASVAAPAGARFVVIGGAALEQRRHIWWNFVSSRRERIEQAKADWAAQRMGTIPGEREWMPLPD
jgi:redox-sensitive bicupin YhaK (pirin superfamily)